MEKVTELEIKNAHHYWNKFQQAWGTQPADRQQAGYDIFEERVGKLFTVLSYFPSIPGQVTVEQINDILSQDLSFGFGKEVREFLEQNKQQVAALLSGKIADSAVIEKAFLEQLGCPDILIEWRDVPISLIHNEQLTVTWCIIEELSKPKAERNWDELIKKLGEVTIMQGSGNIDLPKNFELFPNLECLELMHTKFLKFPEQVCDIKTLKRLKFTYNNIDENTLDKSLGSISIPEKIKDLENLEVFHLRGTTISNRAEVEKRFPKNEAGERVVKFFCSEF